jgi:carbamoyltransferase
MRDGEIVCAIARERLTRFKHDGGVTGGANWDPSVCIDYLLETAGIGLDDVDLFVENHLFNMSFEELHSSLVPTFARPYPAERSIMISHHLAHAYSGYYASGFEDALVMVVDGGGNSLEAIRLCSGEDAAQITSEEQYRSISPTRSERISLYSVRDGRFELVRKDFTVGSLGGAYNIATQFIFAQSTEAGKTMGLAPFGKPGAFEMSFIESQSGRIRYPYLVNAMEIDMPEPVKDWPEDPASWDETRRQFADLAWKMQHDLEEALVDIATEGQRATKHKRLCIAGGVGLNSVSNKLILDRAGFDDVYILPPSGDDGISVGCAYWGAWHDVEKRPARRTRMRSASTGRTYSEHTVRAALATDSRLRFERLDEAALLDRAIDEMMKGRIVGWFQGGSEIGPRALGNRSILADARHPDMKGILNRRVKFREAFRPFAPVVTLEHARDYFEIDGPSPYMLLIAPVHEAERTRLPSITHVDGTARVQTVTEEDNGRYYRLVKRFGERTGVPVLVNTSFNIKGEPIVETPAQAVECFLCNDMDVLVIEDWFVEKRELSDAEMLEQRPDINERILVTSERRFTDGAWETTTAKVAFRENQEYSLEVSVDFATLLGRIDGTRTVKQLEAEIESEHELEPGEARDLLLSSIRKALNKNLIKLRTNG